MGRKFKIQIENVNGEKKLEPLKKWIRENHQNIIGYVFDDNDNSHTEARKLINLGYESNYDEINDLQILSLGGILSNIETSIIYKKSNSKNITKLEVFQDDINSVQIFEKFKEKFSRRFNNVSILDLGEDSLRYDFFCSMMEVENLDSFQIQLEYPINRNAFESNLHINSKRKENPQIDLYSPNSFAPLIVEFGMFKRNSNLEGSINRTEKIFKMFNDMIRLKLSKRYINSSIAYFVCLTDEKFLNYKLGGKKCSSQIFPASNYMFDIDDINCWLDNFKSTKKAIDLRFVQKIRVNNITIKANLVYNELITSDIIDNQLQTRLIIYKIE